MNQQLPSTALVIFGISGDLSRRYLLPALAEICANTDLKSHLEIIGLSRRAVLAEDVLPQKATELAGQFQVVQFDYEQPAEYLKLDQQLLGLGVEQVIFYFAVPPPAVLPIVRQLGAAGLNTPRYKLLMEKPFGTDLASAKQLIEAVGQYFKEAQVYRIDHYLAKEMAQNITIFLGSNAIIRDIWDNRFIEKIEIIVEESISIEGRAHFYEQTGALRDIVQSHLLQLVALTLMEPCPYVFDFSQMPARRLAALQQLKVDISSIISGQYQGYKEEVSNTKSQVETFVALKLESADPKWRGVPIQVLTGKSLNEKLTEIRVHFKKSQTAQANLLRLRVQPKEGIELELWVKKPGYDQDLQMLPLEFSYQRHFDRLPDAYEQVIVDAVRGRANLFAGSQEVLTSWQILQPILDAWSQTGKDLKVYKPGSTSESILQNT
jgi:glucose-6-phosphate 1-dehydrogenase